VAPDPEQLPIESAADWRAWLERHHATAAGAWVVTWKKASGGPYVSDHELIDEAHCFGWVDSRVRGLDDRRTQLLLTPRRRGSAWSRLNKERIARLEAEERMADAGRAAVAAARDDGSWTALDAVENLEEPGALRAALDGTPGARGAWDAFPRSAKRDLLAWIASAKRQETRERRIRETAARAARGERANQPR
jgi:uncharacterized protein YdeI (YjbR/CyaY-like superfamily)